MEGQLPEKLYETYYMQVYSFLVSLSGQKELAEDLTQEVFCRVLSPRAAFRGEADALTWLCAIAKNLYYDECRRRTHFADAAPETASDADFTLSVEDKDASFRIHRILHGLSEPYREVFELRIFGELSFAEIARIFGKSESWARVTFHRAKLQICERMRESNYEI